MRQKLKPKQGGLCINNTIESETLEQKIERILENKEPIKDGAPIIYTEKNAGVMAGYNIKTDRFEVALDGIDKIQKSYQARKEEKAKMTIIKGENDGGAEPIQGTK